ncbi:MAG TPA: DoxX family protein, partial [Chloroflexia bacterium]|nr:DoxX family protein [Chloroflexia bacterium]
AAGLTGYLLGLIGWNDKLILGVIGFIPYGYDKLFANNVNFAMGSDFFAALGMPLPEVTAVLVGLLELFGGLALVVGFLTRPIALLLAGSMAVALVTVNNWPEELPLMVACLLLVWLGGGVLALDSPLGRRLQGARVGHEVQGRPARR